MLAREWIRERFWVVPTVLLVAGVAAGLAVSRVDSIPVLAKVGGGLPVRDSSAETLLAIVASSMLTFVGVVFTITLVALQLASAQLSPRVTLYTSYRVNKDNGQGDRIADPTGVPGTLIASYPMSFQSPEARLTIKLHHRLDWNLGYQYYNYNESTLVGPRPQNYHAHMPYTSLRLYFGRRE